MQTLDRPSHLQPDDTLPFLKRDLLREKTAYPFLRKIGTYLIYLSAACAGLLWLVFIYVALNSVTVAPVIPWLIAAVLSTLLIFFIIFLNGLAQAILDMADIQLRDQ